jgi:hypothetical protein
MAVHIPGTSSKTLFAVLLSRRSQARGLARERLRNGPALVPGAALSGLPVLNKTLDTTLPRPFQPLPHEL